MKIALIGADGQLGSDFFKLKTSHEFIPLTMKELDITDFEKARILFTEMKPDVIVNMAALTNLNLCEDEPEKCFQVNAFAQKNLSEIANDIDAAVVFISSDYVFGQDKTRETPYTENDARGPVNVYASSKVTGEDMTIFTAKKYFIVRPAVLFGTAGALGKGGNFVEAMIKIAKEKGEVSVVDDQIVSPTYTLELVSNILKLVEKEKYGIYHMTGQGQCSFYEFAEEIFEQMGMDVKMNRISVDEFEANHTKPKYTVLENKALKDIGLDEMSDWKVMLGKYLKEKGYRE